MMFTPERIKVDREIIGKALSKPPFQIFDGKLGVALTEFAFRILATVTDTYPDDTVYLVLAANNYPAALDEIERLREKLELIEVIAIDYDGYRDVDGLKKLIDELREIAVSALKGGE